MAIDAYVGAAGELETDVVAWRMRIERAFTFVMVIKDRDRGLQILSHMKAKRRDDVVGFVTHAARTF